ncbi:MAG TPA: hypothetical protein VGB37_00605, partial [Candidatus Lokiarchaeia archaeon]
LQGILITYKEKTFKKYSYNYNNLLKVLEKLKTDFLIKNISCYQITERIKELKILIESKTPNKIKEIIKGETTLKVGMYLYTSWGYDQTNNEFFKVIKILGKNYFLIQEVKAGEIEKNNNEFSTYDIVTITGEELNELPIKAYISNDGYMSITETGYKRRLWKHEAGRKYYPTNTLYGH